MATLTVRAFVLFAIGGIAAVGYQKVARMKAKKKVLFVVTSHDKLGNTGKPTGFWLEEVATPYYAMTDAGYEVVLATPKGGKPPIDPKSEDPSNQTANSNRFSADASAMTALQNTKKLSEVDEGEFAAIFFPGGHGPLWDLAEDSTVFWLIEKFNRASKPIAAVCHGPGVFRHTPSIVKGKKVTGFSNSEEKAVGLEKIVPFLVEDMLKEHGGTYSSASDWTPYVVTDNNSLLITGQNPQSSEVVAKELIKKLS